MYYDERKFVIFKLLFFKYLNLNQKDVSILEQVFVVIYLFIFVVIVCFALFLFVLLWVWFCFFLDKVSWCRTGCLKLTKVCATAAWSVLVFPLS